MRSETGTREPDTLAGRASAWLRSLPAVPRNVGGWAERRGRRWLDERRRHLLLARRWRLHDRMSRAADEFRVPLREGVEQLVGVRERTTALLSERAGEPYRGRLPEVADLRRELREITEREALLTTRLRAVRRTFDADTTRAAATALDRYSGLEHELHEHVGPRLAALEDRTKRLALAAGGPSWWIITSSPSLEAELDEALTRFEHDVQTSLHALRTTGDASRRRDADAPA